MRPSFATLLIASCSCAVDEPEPIPPGGPPSLGAGIDSFAGTEAPDSSDLQPLWNIIGSSRIVGLGESVHTSGGFYALKERVIRILIEERGFRTFAMETPRLWTEPTVSYLNGGNCDAATDQQILGGIFSVFSDDNTASLMRWICQWNVEHPSDPVTFFGFDMQQPAEDRTALGEFFQAYAAADAEAVMSGVQRCVAVYEVAPISGEDRVACLAGLDVLDAYLATHHTELVAAAGERAVKLARLSATSWRAYQDEVFFYDSNPVLSYEARDAEMAHVFDELLRSDAVPNAGVVIWAHDFHLSAADLPVGGGVDLASPMGTYLRAMYGDDYRPIAITARRADINWPGVGTGPTAIGNAASSIERFLSQFQRQALIVDTNSTAIPIGKMIEGGYTLSASLHEHWDGMLYLVHSPGMDATYW